MRTLIILAWLVVTAAAANAEILFQTNFDDLEDWVVPQIDSDTITCVVGQSCNHGSIQPPPGFSDYRTAATEACSNLDGNHHTLNINGLHPRGGTGKSFMMWNEPCYSSGGSWGSDGLLGIPFTPSTEVYVRFYILFQPDWSWDGDGTTNGGALGTGTVGPMQKFLHMSHLDEAQSLWWTFASGVQNKPRFTPQLAKTGGGAARLSYSLPHSFLEYPRSDTTGNTYSFAAPPEPCSPYEYCVLGFSPYDMYVNGPSGELMVGNPGGWHSMQFYVRMNSAGGVADGGSKAWFDGRLIYQNDAVKWIYTSNDNPADYKWNHAWLGGNNSNLIPVMVEQWYAVDDVVVSTTYIPDDYEIAPPPIAPTTSITPAPGPYTTPQTVTLSTEPGATTYYTLDGSTPTTSSAVYSTPLLISTTTTLKYFSRDAAGNNESVKTAIYTINLGGGGSTTGIAKASFKSNMR